MNSQDLVKLSAGNEEHKQHKKRTKKIKAQLKDQVIYLYIVDYKTMNFDSTRRRLLPYSFQTVV